MSAARTSRELLFALSSTITPAFTHCTFHTLFLSSRNQMSVTSTSSRKRLRCAAPNRTGPLATAVNGHDRRGRDRRGGDSDGNVQWSLLTVSDNFLRLALTLPSGQAFRWRNTGTHAHRLSPTGFADEWVGCVHDTCYVLRQAQPPPHFKEPDPVWFRVLAPSADDARPARGEALLRNYLRADFDFSDAFEYFCNSDQAFARIFPYYAGMRMLRQCPEECFFAFICSSNNNIKRITNMVTHLAKTYGTVAATYKQHNYYAFPTAETLAEKATESDLRQAGFGYRASFIYSSAQYLVQVAEEEGISARELLLSWRSLPRPQVAKKLTQFPGIGRKVAGCIALMSMDQLAEIPVDTHVWQIAKRYLPHLTTKTLSPKAYETVGDFFRARFGDQFAGVAHNILFIAELPEFKHLLPESLRNVKIFDDVHAEAAKKKRRQKA